MSTQTLSRHTFPARLAELEFTMLVPDGFVIPEVPAQDVNFDDTTQSAALAICSSQIALALVTVAARPAYEDGTVLQWLRYLAGHYGIDLQHVQVHEGDGDGAPPRVTAFGTQVQDGQRLNLMLVAFEDDNRFVTAHAMCPTELWPSFGDVLSKAVESIRLTQPRGGKHPLDEADARARGRQAMGVGDAKGVLAQQTEAEEPDDIQMTPEEEANAAAVLRMFDSADEYREASERAARERGAARAPAVSLAEELLRKGEFDEAERAVMQVDQSIEGGVAIARMYERRLREMVDKGLVSRDKQAVEAVFGRALRWAQHCYPEPHTQIEADDFEAGRKEDRARLVAILGYEPTA